MLLTQTRTHCQCHAGWIIVILIELGSIQTIDIVIIVIVAVVLTPSAAELTQLTRVAIMSASSSDYCTIVLNLCLKLNQLSDNRNNNE